MINEADKHMIYGSSMAIVSSDGSVTVALGGNRWEPFLAPVKGNAAGVVLMLDNDSGIFIWKGDVQHLIDQLQKAFHVVSPEIANPSKGRAGRHGRT